MEVKFIKTNPTQNMTILVESHHTRDTYQHVASRMMAYDHVCAEQVGFIELSECEGAWARLQMMAGEFCGNATMSLAAVMAWRRNLRPGQQLEVPLEVSGSNRILMCQVQAQQIGYLCKSEMPIPLAIDNLMINCNGATIQTVVTRYPGIVHTVVEVDSFNSSIRDFARRMVKCPELLQGEAALGIMLYRRQSHELAPLIYIPDTDTMIWERGCGSGVATIGAYMAKEEGRDIHLEITQPGGMIEVWARCHRGDITSLEIQGHVDISAVGTAFV
ncbi:hypothetical protein D3C73_573380 [compost metagenome]